MDGRSTASSAVARALRACLAVALLTALAAAPAGAESGPGGIAAPGAWVLVDADTGAVLSGSNDRQPMRPASMIKLLTALVAVQRLSPDELVPISARAESMPARKINVKAGQFWQRDHLLHSLLMVSANDAAVALAESIGGGTLDGYVEVADRTARRLGLGDGPVLTDPAGLDDEFSHRGGPLVSARDLAIVARAFLAEPVLAAVAATPEYEFDGGDAAHHHFTNHNRFLRMYDGAIGLKTGTTDQAGRCLVAAARRDGRTMIVVLFDAPDIYATAGALLDQGFATPVGAEPVLDKLPDVQLDAAVDPAPRAIVESAPLAAAPLETVAGDGGLVPTHHLSFNSPQVAAAVFVAGLLPLVLLVRRRQLLVN